MIRKFKLTLLVLMLLFASGCTTGYWADRGRDLADVGAVGFGWGVGAKARTGPVGLGLYAGMATVGLRGGRLVDGVSYNPDSSFGNDYPPTSLDLHALFWGTEEFDDTECGRRGKCYTSCTNGWIPVFVAEELREYGPPTAFHSQVEVCVGLIPAFRLGFNPGELLDFLLGFVGVDIYNDDLEQRERDNPSVFLETDDALWIKWLDGVVYVDKPYTTSLKHFHMRAPLKTGNFIISLSDAKQKESFEVQAGPMTRRQLLTRIAKEHNLKMTWEYFNGRPHSIRVSSSEDAAE